MIDEYSQINADNPEDNPVFDSGIFCSSTRTEIELIASVEHEVGVDEKGKPKSGSASLSFPIGHEKSNDRSLSWSFSVSSFSMKKSTKNDEN